MIRKAWPLQFSLRTLFGVTTFLSAVMAWQAYLADKQAASVRALEKTGARVEVRLREPAWLWQRLGGRFAYTACHVDLPVESAEKAASAIPHLSALPGLTEVHLHVVLDAPATWDYFGERCRAVEAATPVVAEALPKAKVTALFPLITPLMGKITILPEE